jgi:hypothetical protein
MFGWLKKLGRALVSPQAVMIERAALNVAAEKGVQFKGVKASDIKADVDAVAGTVAQFKRPAGTTGE